MSRIYFPIHAVGFAPDLTSLSNPTGFRAAKGVQSVGVDTTFNLEQVFELGQSAIYENIENLPDLSLTVEKVIDGYALLQHLATPAATSATLLGRYNTPKCNVAIAYYPLANDAASGTPLSQVLLSTMYVSAIAWNLPIQGNITESLTLVGNDKQWFYAPSGTWFASTLFTNTEVPITASGGVQRRENVDMVQSRWPTEIPGISTGGGNATGINPSGAVGFAAHIQDVTINVNLGRTELLEQGRKGPYLRYLNVPVEVTTAITVTPSAGTGDGVTALSSQDNLTNQNIYIVLNQGVTIDLGASNKLSSVNMNGGDTGGGNVTCTYNYTTFNAYTCKFSAKDPAGL